MLHRPHTSPKLTDFCLLYIYIYVYIYIQAPALIPTPVRHFIAKLASHFFHIFAACPKRSVRLCLCYWLPTASEKIQLQKLQLCKHPCLILAGCKHLRGNCISVGPARTQRSSLPCAHLVLRVDTAHPEAVIPASQQLQHSF